MTSLRAFALVRTLPSARRVAHARRRWQGNFGKLWKLPFSRWHAVFVFGKWTVRHPLSSAHRLGGSGGGGGGGEGGNALVVVSCVAHRT
jgi:hypothetical protein